MEANPQPLVVSFREKVVTRQEHLADEGSPLLLAPYIMGCQSSHQGRFRPVGHQLEGVGEVLRLGRELDDLGFVVSGLGSPESDFHPVIADSTP